jgi:acetyl esterase/lipase
MDRRKFLAAMTSGAACGPAALGHAQAAAPETHVYKKVDGLEIRADVWAADPGAAKPALLWVHGGALILGSRKSVPRALQTELTGSGYVVVSIDYRLAPETKLPGIIEDLRDAYRWLRTEGRRQFGIDADRVAVAGASAGGYLTLMTGFCVRPRPRALVSFYGYGDITTPWYAEPDPFYRRQPLVSQEEAERVVGLTPLSEPPASNQRGRFYLYCRQQGRWPQEVAGRDPREEKRWFDRYCPVRNVSPQYPPTLLIHGTADTDVPYSESAAMAEKLKERGAPHELLTLQGAGHGLSGAAPEEVARTNARAVEFIRRHTGPPQR